MTWGIRQPVVLLPIESRSWSAQRRHAVLAHELAHVKRGDCLAQLLGQAARALHWFNPLAWLAWRRLLAESERACDDLVLAQGAKASDYAEHLLGVVAGAKGDALFSSAAIAMARPSQLQGRLLAILDEKQNRQRLTRLVATAATIVLLTAVATLSVLKAAEEEKTKVGVPPVPVLKKKGTEEAGGKSVRGRVLDEAGKPLAGADVWLPLFILGAGDLHTVHAKSDALGRFALPVASAWLAKARPLDRTVTVWAHAAGQQLGTASVAVSDSASDVAIQLGPETNTSFTVLDPGGRPCTGALVEPYYVRTSPGYQPLPEELMARLAARTDGEGRVKLPAASPETLYQVRITAKDFGIQVQRTQKSEPAAVVDGKIHLRNVGKIEGRVIARQPELARGVRLVFTTEEHSRSSPPWPTEGHADIRSDENGRFVVPSLAAGVLRIEIRVNENQPLRPKLPQFVRLREGETTSLEIPVVRTVTVRGSVRAKDTGKPVPGEVVHIYYGVYRQGATAVTDAQGNYTAHVLPGRVGVQMISEPKGYVQPGEPWNRSLEVPSVETFDLPPVELVPATGINGRLIDEHDQPVSNVGIFLLEGNRRYGFAKSDGNGQFSMTGVPAGIDPAKATYQWFRPEAGVPQACEIVKANPLVLRALPRYPRIDRP
jgi:hypothetical protein